MKTAFHRLAVLTGATLCAFAGPAYAQEGNSWQALAEMPTPRRLLAAATFEEKIYTFGGCGSPCFEPPAHTSTFEETLIEVYDPETDSWSRRKPIPAILFGAAAATVGDNIYLFGGFVTGTAAYAYDPRNDAWSRRAPMPTARHGMAAVALGEKIYVLGGSTGAAASNAVEVYDPENNRWESLAPMPTARVFLAAAVVDKKIYAIGGSPDCCGGAVTNAVEVYDAETKQWSAAAPLPVALQVSAAAEVNEEVYVFGGFIPGAGVQGSTFEYDPATNFWRSLAAMPEPRDQAPAVALDGKIHVLGGSVNCHCRALGTHSSYTPPSPPIPEDCLRIAKTDGRGTVAPGEAVLYQITVRNVCAVAVSATVTDDLTATRLENVRWCRGESCQPAIPGDLADTVTLPPGGTLTYSTTGTIPCACGLRSVRNTACAAPSNGPEVCAPDTDRIVPRPGADLAFTLTGPDFVGAGAEAHYTVVVVNQGPCTAQGIELRVQLPQGFELVRTSSPCERGLPCNPGDLPPGAGVQFTATVRTPAGFISPAAARVSASVTSVCDPVSVNNADSVDIEALHPPAQVIPVLTAPGAVGLVVLMALLALARIRRGALI